MGVICKNFADRLWISAIYSIFRPHNKEKRGGRSLPAGWLLSVNFYFTVESVPSLNIFARSIFILPTSQNRHSSHAETIPATIIIMAVWKYVNMKFGVKIYSSKRLSLLFAVCICPLHKSPHSLIIRRRATVIQRRWPAFDPFWAVTSCPPHSTKAVHAPEQSVFRHPEIVRRKISNEFPGVP